nr:MAG TPA: hypothetical protein [Caudoviricetes sp.]
MLCHYKRKEKALDCVRTTVKGFVLRPDGLVISFAYRHYSICKNQMQYAL